MRRKPLFTKMPVALAATMLVLQTCLAADPGSGAPSQADTAYGDSAAVEESAIGAAQGRARAQESVNALSTEIQDLKRSVIGLNKNLRVLEEDLLFPANTQVSVFLSLDVGKFFQLESVKLKIDGDMVASHLYTDRELTALQRGGIHRLHMANLSTGEHILTAYFTGMGPSGREYKRGATLKIDKQSGPKHVELRITDLAAKQQPEFSVVEW